MEAFFTDSVSFARKADWVVHLESAHEALSLDLERQALDDYVGEGYFLKCREALEKITVKEVKRAPEGRVMLCFLDLD